MINVNMIVGVPENKLDNPKQEDAMVWLTFEDVHSNRTKYSVILSLDEMNGFFKEYKRVFQRFKQELKKAGEKRVPFVDKGE